MNKYFISGKLTHKASNHNTKRCEIEKWVFLPHSDFERLKANPYQEHEAITAARDLMYEDDKAYHCIMIDMDEVESLVKNAIVQQLSQRDDVIMAKNTDIGVDYQPDIRVEAKELTELKFYCPLMPLFSIPTHHFLFNPGNIKAAEYIDTLQLEPAEYDLIKFPERGTCFYRCGNERYLLIRLKSV